MNEFNELIKALLSLKLTDVTALFDQVINDPTSNLPATLLLLAGVVVLTLIAIMLAVLFIGFGGDEEEGEEAPDQAVTPSVVPAGTGARSVAVAPSRTPRQRLARIAVVSAAIVAGVAAAWVFTGMTTGSADTCLACHLRAMPHVDRLATDGGDDPHVETACVRCHEPGGTVASVTTNVPSRAVHIVKGMTVPKKAGGYGTTIASSACLSCHSTVGDATTSTDERGIKVSHKEPLDAGAMCMDCHTLQNVSGAVGSWTVGMSTCLRCHDNQQASSECNYCHTKDIAYAIHANYKPDPKQLVVGIRCYTCHEERTCDSCHGIRMPHSYNFVANEHPYVATLDNWYNEGKRCKKCHTYERNSCFDCHKMGPFPGHGGGGGGWDEIHGLKPDESRGCDGCHGYLARVNGRNFCGVCHEQYKEYR